jgi:hypothetical protein
LKYRIRKAQSALPLDFGRDGQETVLRRIETKAFFSDRKKISWSGSFDL